MALVVPTVALIAPVIAVATRSALGNNGDSGDGGAAGG